MTIVYMFGNKYLSIYLQEGDDWNVQYSLSEDNWYLLRKCHEKKPLKSIFYHISIIVVQTS